MTPRVSVLMAVFNNERELPRALSGLQSQTFTDFEVVAINDGSTDGSGDALDAVARSDARFRVIHQPNAGLMRALRRACADARGTLWARQDADDVSAPDRLANQVAYLDTHGDTVGCGCWSFHVSPEGGTVLLQGVPDDPVRLRQYLEQGNNPFVHGSMMFRADTYRALDGGYRLTPDCEDYDLWLQMIEHGTLGMVTEPGYAWWLNPNGVSSTSQAIRGQFVQLALSLHHERTSFGAERTSAVDRAREILAQSRQEGSRAAGTSTVTYTAALDALRARRYGDYRSLMRQAAHGEGRWARKARAHRAVAWSAPLLRLALEWRLRESPLRFVTTRSAGEPSPLWLKPHLATTAKPVAP